MPRVIDANQHIWDLAWQPEPHKWMQAERAARRTFPPRDPATIRPRVGNGFMDKSGALNVKINDRLGFDMSIMHVVDYALGYGEEAPATIDEINLGTAAAAAAYPDRLMWFCNVDPRRPKAAEMIERYIKEHGAKGVGEFYPPMGFYPWEEFCEPIYRVCIKYDVPINVHTQAGVKYAEPIHWADVCKKFPDLKVIMEHTGIEAPYMTTYGFEQAMVVGAKCPNVYFNTTEWYIWGCMKNVADVVKRLAIMRDVVGARRIINGTDNPTGKDGRDNGDGEWMFLMRNLATIGKWYGYSFSQDEVDEMIGGAVERLLKLPPKDETPAQPAAVGVGAH